MNNVDCPCKRKQCERHGNCDACKEHHHNFSKRYPLTTCERMQEKKNRKNSRKNADTNENGGY